MPKRTSLLDDLLTFPWWFNLILAAVVYFGLKYYLPSVELQNPAIQGIGKVFANMAGMFASIFVFSAVISAYHAWRRGELLDRQTSARSIKAVSWKEFEYLVSEAYRRQGYSVRGNPGVGADGGVDLVLSKDGERFLVQCKNWRSSKIGVSVVRELFGVVTAEGASGGIVVCSGCITNDAVEFARGKPVTLVDGSALTRLIGHVQKSPKIQAEDKPQIHDKTCPVCQSPMVIRTARRGKNAGSSFWGCSRYPECRGARAM
ncbi:MAG: restriction endonuclease [Saprospiraceae bacterium]|nr:restriction endonuclease [Saprospiraceae bacterium]